MTLWKASHDCLSQACSDAVLLYECQGLQWAEPHNPYMALILFLQRQSLQQVPQWVLTITSWEQPRTAAFPLLCCLPLQVSNHPSEEWSVLFLTWTWFHGPRKDDQSPLILHLFPRYPSEITKVLGDCMLYFLFCVPWALETSLVFVGNLE